MKIYEEITESTLYIVERGKKIDFTSTCQSKHYFIILIVDERWAAACRKTAVIYSFYIYTDIYIPIYIYIYRLTLNVWYEDYACYASFRCGAAQLLVFTNVLTSLERSNRFNSLRGSSHPPFTFIRSFFRSFTLIHQLCFNFLSSSIFFCIYV